MSEDKEGLRNKIKLLQQENDCLCEELDKRENEIVKLRTHGGKSFHLNIFLKVILHCLCKLRFILALISIIKASKKLKQFPKMFYSHKYSLIIFFSSNRVVLYGKWRIALGTIHEVCMQEFGHF